MSAEDILQFWFKPEDTSQKATATRRWFDPDAQFDELCKVKFLARHEEAANGRLEHWKNSPRSCLALILLLDQFPRNMFRGTARAFATDAKAREVSRHAIASGFERDLTPDMRMFIYLPFEHSENLDDQRESIRLYSALIAEYPDHKELLGYAQRHMEIVRRFGRFPARNKALGRKSTAEEIHFLEELNSE